MGKQPGDMAPKSTGLRGGPKSGIAGSAHARISDLIGAVYDCVLAPAKWSQTLEDIRREYSFANAILGVLRIPSGGQILQATVGVPAEWLARVERYNADIVELWGGAERIRNYPLDEPLIQSQAVGPAAMQSNPYFREWAVPQGIHDALAIAIIRDSSAVGSVAFGRYRADGPIGEREVTGIRLLAPHFRRAVTISKLFDMKTVEASTFGSVLDALAIGVVLVDEHLGIVHANPAAETMFAARDPIQSEKGVLALRSGPASAALQDAVERAAGNEAAMGQRGIGIPANGATGHPAIIHVLPLRRGELRRGLVRRAVAAIFVAPASSASTVPTDALALLYDLTPAETRIFELICAGKTVAEIGGVLGIAISTVKTHLRHVFEKTGQSRQIDLVKFAAGLSLTV